MEVRLGPRAIAGGYRVATFDTIASTSSEALSRAKDGDPGRLWVVAGRQTAGHGRRGRPWQTPRGNLAASLLLPQAPSHAATLGFVAGLALESAIRTCAPALDDYQGDASCPTSPLRGGRNLQAEGAQNIGRGSAAEVISPPPEPGFASLAGFDLSSRGRLSGAHPPRHSPMPRLRLKWPNDVLLDGAKVAGILLEATTLPGGTSRVVVGIGVNVLHAPEGLPYPATSLARFGAPVTAERLFEALAETWVEQESLWDSGRGFPAIRDLWLERAAGLGELIAVRVAENVVHGTFETIGEDGRLIVRTANGSVQPVTAGDVYFGDAATARG